MGRRILAAKDQVGLLSPWLRTAMPAPMPEGIQFKYHPDYPYDLHGHQRGPTAYAVKDYDQLGYVTWHPDGEVKMIDVNPDYRRHGIGTALFDFAKQHEPNLHHSPHKSDLGEAWSSYEKSRHTALNCYVARAPYNPAGGPLWRGMRVKWSPEELSQLNDLHQSGDHQALAHTILDKVQHGSTAGEWNAPREDGGGLGVYWSGSPDVSHSYSHHGDGHDPKPAGPFENVVVQADKYNPEHEWTPYDDDADYDEDLNEFLNEDRETDLYEGAPVSISHVHVKPSGSDGDTLSIPLAEPRSMTAALHFERSGEEPTNWAWLVDDEAEKGLMPSPGRWTVENRVGPALGKPLSEICWNPEGGEVNWVTTHKDHRLKGHGRALFNWVRDNHEPNLHHSEDLTEDGQAFSRHVSRSEWFL